MKEFIVYAGNQFYDAQEQAFLLGYKYPDPHEEPNIRAFYLTGTEGGSLSWASVHPKGTTITLEKFMSLTPEDVKSPSERKFCTGQWVLVKNKVQGWKLDIYSHRGPDSAFPHVCVSGNWRSESILPFEGNEHLLGRTL